MNKYKIEMKTNTKLIRENKNKCDKYDEIKINQTGWNENKCNKYDEMK